MTRGGRVKTRDEPERRCIATGESGATDRLIRFVLGPASELVPDLAGKLPGRGVWLTAERALIEKSVAKKLFARAFKAPVTAPADLVVRLEALLVARLADTISLARKAGQAVTGFEKVRARLREGSVGVLVQASDGAEDGKTKLARLAATLPRIEVLTADELGLAFGRDFAIHAALDRGGFAKHAMAEAKRLGGVRCAGLDANKTRRSEALTGDGMQEGPATDPGQGDE